MHHTYTVWMTLLLTLAGSVGLQAQHAFFDLFPDLDTWTNIRLAATPDDGLLVGNDLANGLEEGEKHGFYLARYDSCGRLAWAQAFHTDTFALFLADVGVTAQGQPVAVGQTGAGDVFVLMLDQAGMPAWLRTYQASAYDQCHALAIDEAGLTLLGTHQAEGRPRDWLLRLNLSGEVSWSRTTALAAGTGHVAVAPGGGWWVRNGNLLYQVDPTGQTSWVRRIDNVSALGGRWSNLAALPGGGLAVALREPEGGKFRVLALDNGGQLLGMSPALSGADYAPTLAITPTGYLAYAGPLADGRPALAVLGLQAEWQGGYFLHAEDMGASRRLAVARTSDRALALAGVSHAGGANQDFVLRLSADGNWDCAATPVDFRTEGNFSPSLSSLAPNSTSAPFVVYDSVALNVRPLNLLRERRCEWTRDARDWPIDSSIVCTDILDWVSPLEEATYLWWDGATVATRTLQAPGRYAVTASTCRTDYEIDLRLRLGFCPCSWYVPNAFSPNGDDVNDRWMAYPDCPWTSYRVWVYNRWGALVYESTQPDAGWDGRVGGQPAPPGAYVYRIEYTYALQPALPRTQQLSGLVTLTR